MTQEVSSSGHGIAKKIGNILFFIFILIVLIDPTNTILHKKDIVFVILVAYCMMFFKPNVKMLIPIFALFTAFCIPWIICEARATNYDTSMALARLKSLTPIVLLLWTDRFDLLKLAKAPVVICCIITSTIFIAASLHPEIEAMIWAFYGDHDSTVMMSHRWIAGVQIFAVYLKSTIVFIFVLAYYLHCLFNKGMRSFMNTLCLIIVFFNFVVSGTRSTMLVPFFILGIVVFVNYRNHPKVKPFIYPAIILGAFMFLAIIVLLASETSEASNQIKYAHIPSYIALFANHPVDLLVGQGPGTSFYSEGFNKIVYETEWTYLELIRSFGIFSIVIVAVFAYPLVILWRNRNDKFTFCMFWTYVAYMLIAGTNPLLLSSTGMMSLLIAYSYSSKIARKKELKKTDFNDE